MRASLRSLIPFGASLSCIVVACGTDPDLFVGADASTADTGAADAGPKTDASAATYSIGGTVLGLKGSGLVLRNNGGDDVKVSAPDAAGNVTFTFPTSVEAGSAYSIEILTQPSIPTQTCTLSGNAGTLVAGNVSTVVVNCTTNTYTVGGKIAGLAGTGLVLQNNGGNDIAVSSSAFAFPMAMSGEPFAVTVLTQPSALSQTCIPSSPAVGTIADANVTIDFVCSTNAYTVKATVDGLVGTGLALQNNLGDNLPFATNTTLAFATKILSGGTYGVTTLTQPTSPSQECSASVGSGSVTDADIDVAVKCRNKRKLSVKVSGLIPGSVTFQNNGADDLVVSANGSFTFPADVVAGKGYALTVSSQPKDPPQTCFVTTGAAVGTVPDADSTINVKCETYVTANGLNWYYNSAACAQPCNTVCSLFGKVPANDAVVFEAQNTEAECQSVSSAFGISDPVFVDAFLSACIEDTGLGNKPHGTFYCSTRATCPARHRTVIDSPNGKCGDEYAHRSICACE